MNVPYHLLNQTASVERQIGLGGFSQDYTGQAIPTELDDAVDIPCRITPLSGDDHITLGGELGSLRYSGLFPAPQVLKDTFGLTDFRITAQSLVTVDNGSDEVVYRVIGPATTQRADRDVLQRVYLETWNQEVAPQ